MSPVRPPLPPRAFASFDEAHGGAIAAASAGLSTVEAASSAASAHGLTHAPGAGSERIGSYVFPGIGVIEPAPEGAAPGKVYLVGGGPGSVELLTLKAVQCLSSADVVLLDHLAPQDIASFAPNAQIIEVGKNPGKHVVPQSHIQQLILALALSGKTVVRLKGGDPFVFGRGAEELDACTAAGIECTVVPGVSSAIAVPAAASIPVTMRKVSHMFTVLSGHSALSDADLDALAATLRAGGTGVLLMGVRTLGSTVAGLLARGLDDYTPMATIERGYSADQRVTVTVLGAAERDCSQVQAPAITVFGEVVRYARDDQQRLLAEVADYI